MRGLFFVCCYGILNTVNRFDMKKEKITSTRIIYSEKCDICNRNIKGFSESNLKYNMRLHKEKHDKEVK